MNFTSWAAAVHRRTVWANSLLGRMCVGEVFYKNERLFGLSPLFRQIVRENDEHHECKNVGVDSGCIRTPN